MSICEIESFHERKKIVSQVQLFIEINMQKTLRLKREIERIMKSPPPGISCTPKDDKIDVLDASIMGMDGTAYESGIFKLEIIVPDKYPFEPPRITFTTPVYHPNVDVAGRICLDLLRLPPKGSWRPVISLSGLLTAVQLLLTQPNPDDPLMADIAEEFRFNKPEYDRKAREYTKKYACHDLCVQEVKSLGKEGTEKAVESNIHKNKRKLDTTEDGGVERTAKCLKE